MEKLTIITDLDDVLENFCEVWIKYLNARFDKDVKYEDVRQWDISKSYPDVEKHLMYECLEKESFWKLLHPIEDSEAITKELIAEGHNLYVATSATPVSAVYKMNHIMRRFFPHIQEKNFIVIRDKSLLHGDVMIDDNPLNLGGDFRTKILFSAPHNRSCPAAAQGFLRADNWQTVYKIICEVSGQW